MFCFNMRNQAVLLQVLFSTIMTLLKVKSELMKSDLDIKWK